MTDKIKIDLGSVQKTLLLPLWGRAVETKKPKPILIDTAAAEIINKIDYDFSTITAKIRFVTQLAWIARSFHIDNTIKSFLSFHPDAHIVNIGCGLDTTYERVNNGKLSWYDLDLPDVMELRKTFMHETENRKFITASLLDDSWVSYIKNRDNVFFIAAGVLYYFDETQVRQFFSLLADKFPYSEIIFDAVTPQGLNAANKGVIKDSGMDESAYLKWSIKNSRALQSWDSRINIINEYPLFKEFKKPLSFKEKYGTFLSDLFKIMFIVHLRFGS